MEFVLHRWLQAAQQGIIQKTEIHRHQIYEEGFAFEDNKVEYRTRNVLCSHRQLYALFNFSILKKTYCMYV